MNPALPEIICSVKTSHTLSMLESLTTSTKARELVTEAISRFRLDGFELKGKKLTCHTRGQRAVSWLLRELGEDIRLVVFDKQYALAWKFFAYIFEPVLAAQSSIFYRAEFNYFIAMLLYVELGTTDRSSRVVCEECQQLMRTYDIQHLDNLIAIIDVIAPHRPLWKILSFATLHQDKIKREIHEMRQMGEPLKWVLELTASALFGILSHWGERFDCMEVFCDESKPLKVSQQVFNQMIGRKEKVYHPLSDKPSLLTFNLATQICFVNSSTCPGIQLADIVASSMAFVICNRKNTLSKEWIEILSTKLGGSSLLPDSDDINLQKGNPFINGLILEELIERSVKGEDVFAAMPEFIQKAKNAYLEYSSS